MSDRFSEQVDWIGAAFALAVWLAHFTLLWGASIVFPDQAAARWIALGVTIAALAGLAWLWFARRIALAPSVPALGVAMATLAILFGAVPPIVG